MAVATKINLAQFTNPMNELSNPVTCPVCNAPAKYEFSSRDLMFNGYTRFDYFMCTQCSCVFLSPMPDIETIHSFYPSDYSIYEEQPRLKKTNNTKQALLRYSLGYAHLNPPFFFRMIAPLIALLQKPSAPEYIENGKLADIGCGNGRYLSTMQSLGWAVQGVELSEHGVKSCRAAKVPVHHGDLISANFPSAEFDVVTVRHVIEHINSPHAFMQELSRILKPGGRLIIETPNSQALGRQLFGANWFANEVPRHLILYSPQSLSRLASQYGLSTVDQKLDATPKIFLNSIDYLIKNQGKPSKYIWWRRLLSRIYVALAMHYKRGDVIHMAFTK